MWSARRIGVILAYAAIPLLLVVGSVALAIAEGAPAPKTTPAATSSPLPTTSLPALSATAEPTNTAAPTSTMPTRIATSEPTASPTASPKPMAPIASPTGAAQPTGALPTSVPVTATAMAASGPVAPQAKSCGPFPGWSTTCTVGPGDSLFDIALRYRTSVWELRQANCKASASVVPGERLWVPGEKTSYWGHRPLPAFRWQWWKHFPWVGGPEFAPHP
jgi:LysM repeat protein